MLESNAMEVDEPDTGSQPQVLPSARIEDIEVDGYQLQVALPVESQPENTILLPRKVDDGVFQTTYTNINSLKRPELLELCKSYSLGSVGNKDLLRQKLIAFSENRMRWQSLLPQAQRAHRGVRSGGITKNKQPAKKSLNSSAPKAKVLKPSTLRRNELMGLPHDAPLGTQLFATERSKDMRTLEEKKALLTWAHEYCAEYPYLSEEEVTRKEKEEEEQRAKEEAASPNVLAALMQSMLGEMISLNGAFQGFNNSRLPSLQEPSGLPIPSVYHLPVNAVPQQPPQSLDTSAVASSFTYPSLIANAASSAPLLSTTEATSNDRPGLGSLTNETPTAHVDSGYGASTLNANETPTAHVDSGNGASTPNAADAERVYELTIGHGQVIRYRLSSVREPNMISFSGSIDRLDRVWDDERPNWDPTDCGQNLLKIDGVPIALRYWQEVFCGKRSTIWPWLKKHWNEWRYVVERYQSGSPQDFWKEFSEKDESTGKVKPFTWKRITDRLRDLRNEQEQALTDKARAEYGDRFSQVFVNNQGKVLRKPSAIAKHYLAELSRRSTA
ncbi:hypothetical protein C8R42DRAFT_655819 [Lentinula raphanica]|nr:hypothetical protein C8R42DRAFT_655819 [Lentinula raphanica]